MSRDELYRHAGTTAGGFNFGRDTAAVFDDMLERSVPFYGEIQRLLGEIAARFARPGTRIYDLGCSTGTTLINLHRTVPPGVVLVGVDQSPDMLELARAKLRPVAGIRPVELIQADLNDALPLTDASVVILNLTLQFVRPAQRARLIAGIAADLRGQGCLLLVEKVLGQNPLLDRLFVEGHFAFKQRRGYSELEIARKREALENVLIPRTERENLELLGVNGFATAESFFRWYNFCGILALPSHPPVKPRPDDFLG